VGRRLGQHFLTRKSTLDRIAESACGERTPLVIEIGAGRGALTESLLARADKVVAIEVDPVLIHYLRQKFRDALREVAATTIEYHNGHAFTFGRPIVLEQTVWTPTLRLGHTVVGSVNAYIGDFHIFDFWGLQGEPTMLIGMDVLARSREMAIDYEHGVVYFRKRPRGK